MRALELGKKVLQNIDIPVPKEASKTIPSWRQVFSKPASEFPLSKLSVISGSVPTDLKGTFYRNGAGRIKRGDDVAKHWVDGDGAILGIHFGDGEAKGTYKYIKSQAYLEEEAENKLIYAGFGSTMNLPFWRRPIIQKIKNAGNVSVLPLADKLLALWDGGLPYSLCPLTLKTLKDEKLDFLTEYETFSAHPKIDPVTQEIYNFGFKNGPVTELVVHKLDKNGKLLKRNSIPSRFNMMHDCVIAGKYLVLMSFPTQLTSLPSFLLGIKPIKELIKWTPDLGTEVFIFDRNDMSLVKQFKIDPFYSCHFTNGYVQEDGNIYIELVTYKDYHAFDNYAAAVTDLDKPLPPGLTAKLGYMKLNPNQGKLIEMKHITEPGVEFPNVVDQKVGEKWRYTYLASKSDQNDHIIDDQFGAVGRFDYKTQNLQTFEFGKDIYNSEPALASFNDGSEDGHMLTQVYDAVRDKSEIWIHDTRNFEGEPVCKLALPSNVPLGFHGKWQPRD